MSTDRPSSDDRESADVDGPSASAPRPGDQALPWKATEDSRHHWGPAGSSRSGSSLVPLAGSGGLQRRDAAMSGTIVRSPARTPGAGLLTVGLPVLSGGLAGATSLVLGLGNLFAGPLDVAAVAVGVGALMAGGVGLLMRALRPKPSLLVTAGEEISEQTRTMLEGIMEALAASSERVRTLRGRSPDPAAAPVLTDLDALLGRIAALVNSETIQSRAPYDGELLMLESIAVRSVPELLDAIADNIRFLASFAGTARTEALANLETIDQQIDVLAEGVERIEHDIVQGLSRSLKVHSEFLRSRFADRDLTSIIDV